MLAGAAFIVISAGLVLLRPSKMMWAFFIYGSFGGVGGSVLGLALAPLWAYVVYVLILQPAQHAGVDRLRAVRAAVPER